MRKLNQKKIFVSLRPGVTLLNPIIPRHYTLTHSDTTAELFLAIGRTYAYDKIGAMRDEVRAKWVYIDKQYKLYIYVYVGGPFKKDIANQRYRIFIKELPLTLKALRYGDRLFFKNYPPLDFAPIWVHFQSVYPEFNHTQFWGMPEQYG